MNVAPTSSGVGSLMPRDAGARTRALSGQREFASILGRASELGEGGARATPAQARDAAEQFVAAALVQPVLKGLRESNGAAEPFKPNSAEQSFRGMMDAQLAQRMVKSRHWPLVDHIASSLQHGASWRGSGTRRAPLAPDAGGGA